MIDTIAPARISEYCALSMSPSVTPVWPMMNENSPIWLRPAPMTSAARTGSRQQHRHQRRDEPFADDDHERDDRDLIPVLEQVARIDEHADGHEEDDRERFLKRHQVGADLLAERRFVDDDAGDERAKRERHAEDARRGQRRADGHRQHDEHEQLARLQVRRRCRGPPA